MFDFGKKEKRALGTRDKQILHLRANYKCEACGKKIGYDEMQVGHKKAYSKGGSTTLRNSVCLCYRCNKLQGTDDWQTFLRKIRKKPEKLTTTKKTTTKKAPAKKKTTTKKAPAKKKTTTKRKSAKKKDWFDL